MSVRLLDKTRKIGKLLHNAPSSRIDIGGLCQVLSEVFQSNIYVIDRAGEALFAAESYAGRSFERRLSIVPGTQVKRELSDSLMRIFSTKENVSLSMLGCEEGSSEVVGIVSPVDMAGERLGSILIFRKHDPYDIDDVILAEYAAVLVAMELSRTREDGVKQRQDELLAVKAALGSLSSTELRAVAAVLCELKAPGGLLVTLRVSEKYGITRSIIINALRKLESAGIIDIRSAGAKGTKIKVKNELIFSEVIRYSADIL